MIDEPPCSTCVEVGRRGYCAPGRCYCGHETCHGFASFVRLVPVSELEVEASALLPPTRHGRLCPSGRPITADGECCSDAPHAERMPA